MEQLLKITSVPVSIKMTINDAKLEFNNEHAQVEVSRDAGGLHVKSKPIKLKIDSFEAFNSVVPTAMRSVEQAAGRGKSRAYQTTEAFAKEGRLYMKAKIGEDVITQITADKAMPAVKEYGLGFLPSVPPEISWEPAEMDIQYEMDKLNFDWKTQNGSFEFIPGNIEFIVEEKAEVSIEYIGSPIYVPPSADPNFQPTTDIKI